MRSWSQSTSSGSITQRSTDRGAVEPFTWEREEGSDSSILLLGCQCIPPVSETSRMAQHLTLSRCHLVQRVIPIPDRSTISWLVAATGADGPPKCVALSQKSIVVPLHSSPVIGSVRTFALPRLGAWCLGSKGVSRPAT